MDHWEYPQQERTVMRMVIVSLMTTSVNPGRREREAVYSVTRVWYHPGFSCMRCCCYWRASKFNSSKVNESFKLRLSLGKRLQYYLIIRTNIHYYFSLINELLQEFFPLPNEFFTKTISIKCVEYSYFTKKYWFI